MMTKSSESLNETRNSIIVFLTDGEATEGETNKVKILANVDRINKHRIPVFGLSFGADADFDLMRKLSLRNNAVARRIYEASDTSLQLKNFYDEISAALIADLKFSYLGDNVSFSIIIIVVIITFITITFTIIIIYYYYNKVTNNLIALIKLNVLHHSTKR